MKLLKLLVVLAALLVHSHAYEVEEEVLILHDGDFPSILEEFNYILIEFYAPWCGHCQRLAPAYTEAAKALAAKGSSIKLAKVDATKEPTSASDYGVSGYPTIFFFLNGTKIDFNGDRTKEAIIGWLEKKILPATSDVSSQSELDQLAANGEVNLVLYTTSEEDTKEFGALAAADDYNKYYTAAGELLSKYSETTVEIIRGFGGVLTFEGVGEKFGAWIEKHSRPLVLEFDERTIKDIFQKQKSAVVLFNKEKSEELVKKLEEASGAYTGDIAFVELTPENEHYERFGEFIKLDVSRARLIALKASEQKKAVYAEDLATITGDAIKEFASALEEGRLNLSPMQEAEEEDAADEEKAEAEAEAEEEPAAGEEAGEEL